MHAALDPRPASGRWGGRIVASGGLVAWQDPCNTPTSNADDLQLTDSVDGRNEITAANARTNLSGSFNAKTVRYDAAGSLAFDGTYIYQFDAWGRLAQVNAGAADGGVTPDPVNPYVGLVFGPMLKHYTYDGVGRLVRTQSPFPNPQEAGEGMVRSERFYYDGIRRIQETILDPTMSMAMPFRPMNSRAAIWIWGRPAALAREYIRGPGDSWGRRLVGRPSRAALPCGEGRWRLDEFRCALF